MEIQNLNLVYFSPTHTTQKILHAVAEGVSSSSVKDIDLTLKRSTDQVYKAEPKTLTIPKICAGCFDCAAVCPTQAIHSSDSAQTDDTLCIRCCACVKSCPTGARRMADPRIVHIADWLFTNYSIRKEPEIFI